MDPELQAWLEMQGYYMDSQGNVWDAVSGDYVPPVVSPLSPDYNTSYLPEIPTEPYGTYSYPEYEPSGASPGVVESSGFFDSIWNAVKNTGKFISDINWSAGSSAPSASAPYQTGISPSGQPLYSYPYVQSGATSNLIPILLIGGLGIYLFSRKKK